MEEVVVESFNSLHQTSAVSPALSGEVRMGLETFFNIYGVYIVLLVQLNAFYTPPLRPEYLMNVNVLRLNRTHFRVDVCVFKLCNFYYVIQMSGL